MKDALIKRIGERDYTIGIVGLGYVGLPLLAAFHKQGFRVVGIDIDTAKIEAFRTGTSYIKHFPASEMQELSASERVRATNDFAIVSDVDAVILCVPTPLTKHREPDMSYIIGTSNAIAPHLKRGQIIILESTTYPGTTDELIRPICEKASGLVSGKDIYFAFSPEREDPGNPNYGTATIPKVIGGDGEDALDIAEALSLLQFRRSLAVMARMRWT